MSLSIGDHGVGNGSTSIGNTSVIFYFGGSVAATIGGSAFTSSDVPLKIDAPPGTTLDRIPFTVTAGNLRIVQVGGILPGASTVATNPPGS